MFSGIISHIGTFRQKKEGTFVFSARASLVKQIKKGTSVAVNGTCLTVEHVEDNKMFSVAVVPETIKKTMLDTLEKNEAVNLELPATPNTFLSGHIVLGHVDTVGKIKKIEQDKQSRIVTISFPRKFSRYIVEKGSIAVNGVSLTIIYSKENSFSVGIIPYTWTHTMFHTLSVNRQVNIEIDILAKHIEKLSHKSYE